MAKEKTPKILPRGKQILVKPDDKKTIESDNGVFLPSNTPQEQKSIGEVIAVGPEIKDIKKGDRVIFAVLAGDKIELKKVEYVLLHDEDVLAFLQD